MSKISFGLATPTLFDRSSVIKQDGQFSKALIKDLATAAQSQTDLNYGKKEAIRATKVITQRDYPALATLKLAGRRTEDIAESYGMSAERILPHISRAIIAYRKGEIDVDSGEVRNEAAAKAEEEGTKVTNSIASAVEGSAAINNAFAIALGSGGPVAATSAPASAPAPVVSSISAVA